MPDRRDSPSEGRSNMARSSGHDPRTVLEHLLSQSNYTYEELAVRFVKRARADGESATITPRHLARLAHGERAGAGTNPSTGRVLESLFGRPVDELLSPWAPGTDLERSSRPAVRLSAPIGRQLV